MYVMCVFLRVHNLEMGLGT